MLEVLKEKIQKLEDKKEKLRKDFSEYEVKSFLDNYSELQRIDGALEVLRELLMEELLKLNQ